MKLNKKIILIILLLVLCPFLFSKREKLYLPEGTEAQTLDVSEYSKFSDEAIFNGIATFNAGLYVTGGYTRINGGVTEVALDMDRLDLGVTGGTPRIVLEDKDASASYKKVIEIDNCVGTLRFFTKDQVLMWLTTFDGTSTEMALKNGADIPIRLRTNGDTYFTGGNVGFGITTPQKQVHVVGEIRASSSTTSTAHLSIAGAFDSLPTSGYDEGTFLYLTSEHKVYVATENVVGVQSWRPLW